MIAAPLRIASKAKRTRIAPETFSTKAALGAVSPEKDLDRKRARSIREICRDVDDERDHADHQERCGFPHRTSEAE